jgi:GR25 family glycosyltransferase involved in LPS biosynthesis
MKAFVINLPERSDRMIDFRKNNFPFEVERFGAIKTDPGWLGCAASHIKIMKGQKEFPFVIFEDDCVLLDSWDKVEKAMFQLPLEWAALWLGSSNLQTIERYSENLFKIKGQYCHHAVIYNSKSMIDFYVNNYLPGKMPIDDFTSSVVSHQFNCFLIHPMIATQRVNFSDIEGKINDYSPWFNDLQNKLNASR